MNDDELKKLWQQQPLTEPNPSAPQIISAMQRKTAEFRRTIASRDLRELVACAIVIIIFGFYAFYERTPIVRLGWLIVIGGAIFSAWKLVHARRSAPPPSPGATLVESLRAELNSVRAQSRLLGSVLWWYLLPPGIGLLVATWGMPIHLHAKIPATLIYVAVYAFIYWLNQKARSSQLLPMEAQLESLLHSAETGQPLDETHVANMRPIVLSMAAADHEKPVEFNVAFSQIAFYGEVGFVGMWFFMQLSHTLDKFTKGPLNAILVDFASRLFSFPSLLLLVPFFLAGLLFSWLLYKMTQRAVGISALGIHLHRGQTLLLWDEIKTIHPLRVLFIRSLWLIKESGEKTITPWTSLERHSDLKAAIERSTPPTHPIRKFLSLLK